MYIQYRPLQPCSALCMPLLAFTAHVCTRSPRFPYQPPHSHPPNVLCTAGQRTQAVSSSAKSRAWGCCNQSCPPRLLPTRPTARVSFSEVEDLSGRPQSSARYRQIATPSPSQAAQMPGVAGARHRFVLTLWALGVRVATGHDHRRGCVARRCA